MIRSKGKHHFWSQILAGIIAIFLLPATQDFVSQSRIEPVYQNEQTVLRRSLFNVVLQFKKTGQIQTSARKVRSDQQKFLKIEPHFIASQINPSTPIRAGPLSA